MRTAIILALGALLCCVGVDASAVHVRGYTRKDGTYVQPHERRPAGTASSSTHGKSSEHSPSHTSSHPRNSTSGTAQHDANGHIKRSPSARAAFMREHPCPSTGRTTGACPGYVVDHVTPLKRGGADSPSNMQWQTVEAAKAKDRSE